MPTEQGRGERVAFNINVYNKFDELEILITILRQEFGDDAFINVSCNNTDKPADELERLATDTLISGNEFRLNKLDDETKTKFVNPEITSKDSIVRKLISLRRIEQFTRGVTLCADESDAAFTVNLHADSWPLSRSGIERILSSVRESGRPFGSRGFGYSYTSPERYPHGAIHDIFFVAENKTVRETSILDFDPSNIAIADPNTHGTLASMIQFRYGADGILWYSDLTDTLGWDDEPKLIAPNPAMRPLTYEPSSSLFHINRNFFPDDYGARFMSKYLVENGFTTGTAIERHIDEYPPGGDLVSEYEEFLSSHPLLATFERTKRHNVNARQYMQRYNSSNTLQRFAQRAKQHAVRVFESNPAIGKKLCLSLNKLCSVFGYSLVDRYSDNIAFFAAVQQQLGRDNPLPGIIEFDIVDHNRLWSRTFVDSNMSNYDRQREGEW